MSAAFKLPVPAQGLEADQAKALIRESQNSVVEANLSFCQVREAIRYPGNLEGLEVALERVQAAFEAGHLSQAQAERLAWLSIQVARQLAAGLVNVPAAAFIGKEECPGAPAAAD